MSEQRSTERPTIIARGFREEPHLLYALEIQPNGRYVNVARFYPCESYIGWPLNDAFDYNEEQWRQLRAAFKAKDEAELQRLWATMRYREFVKEL